MHCYLTVDLEDYKYNIMQRMGIARPLNDPKQPLRGVDRIISILNKTPGNKKITFFTTGQAASENPGLIKGLSRDGHEIACHTYTHKYIPCRADTGGSIYEFKNSEEFKNDLLETIRVLKEHSGQNIAGFRAPNFSINEKNRRWVYEVLSECGFAYDSSAIKDGKRDGKKEYDEINNTKGVLCEFPLYRRKIFGILPVKVIGGTWFRILPARPKFPLPSIFSITGLMKKAFDNGYAPIIYLHPSDIDDKISPVSMSQMKGLNFLRRIKWKFWQIRWMLCRKSTAKKLEIVLKEFPNKGPISHFLPDSVKERMKERV